MVPSAPWKRLSRRRRRCFTAQGTDPTAALHSLPSKNEAIRHVRTGFRNWPSRRPLPLVHLCTSRPLRCYNSSAQLQKVLCGHRKRSPRISSVLSEGVARDRIDAARTFQGFSRQSISATLSYHVFDSQHHRRGGKLSPIPAITGTESEADAHQ